MRFAIVACVALCVSLGGCRGGSESLGSSQAVSPDGQWVAKAKTVAQSGFGTGYISTKVYLNWTKGSQSDVQILGLSYEYEIPAGITDVDLKWITPKHLELVYRGRPTVVFQAIRCGGIDISTEDVSEQNTGAPGQGKEPVLVH